VCEYTGVSRAARGSRPDALRFTLR
jgi:hypothetical protein